MSRRSFPLGSACVSAYLPPVATKKKTQPKRAKKVTQRVTPRDEFSAAGGMPLVPAGLPVGKDFSSGRQLIKELSWGEFDRQVQALARAALPFKPEAVIGLVHGGVFVGGALASALKADFYPVRVSQRSRDSGRDLQATEELPDELAGKRVLIVDDIASSGDSIVFATRLARAHGVKATKSAALIARPGKFEPDFVGLTSADFFVFPWDYQDVVEDRRFETGEVPAVKPARKAAAR